MRPPFWLSPTADDPTEEQASAAANERAAYYAAENGTVSMAWRSAGQPKAAVETPTDPATPEGPDGGNFCKRCGQAHSGGFPRKIAGDFRAILCFFAHCAVREDPEQQL